jgi:hypothetical protein
MRAWSCFKSESNAQCRIIIYWYLASRENIITDCCRKVLNYMSVRFVWLRLQTFKSFLVQVDHTFLKRKSLLFL